MASGVCIKGWNVVMLTRRLLHIEELVIHSSLGQAQACTMLCCAGCAVWPSGLCCAGHFPWLRDRLGQLPLGTGDYTICASLPLPRSAASPQEILNRDCLLLRKSCNSSNDQNEVTPTMYGVGMASSALIRGPLNAAQLRVHSI